MDKKTIIKTLEKIALYMELQGENPFKVSAFRKAAQVLELDERSLSEMDNITSLKGIGAATGAVINDLIETGESSLLKEMQESVPGGLLPMLKIPGLGGKKIAKLYKELGVDSIESLKIACEEGKVKGLAGFGAKTEEKILAQLEVFQTKPERTAIWQLEPIVAFIEGILASMDTVVKYSVAGSYRRVKESSKDIDFIVATTLPLKVREELLEKLPLLKVIAAGDTKVSVTLDVENEVDVDFRLVEPHQYASALHHFTGSKDHNIKMRQIAKEKGLKISEYGVEQEDGSVQSFESEKEFYAYFDLPFIPPTIREDGTELNKLEMIPSLVTLEDIKGDFHMHTTWSDGAHSIEEMVEACREKGYSHIVITDHSNYLKVANGLSRERLLQQIEAIHVMNEKYSDIEIFAGTEMDILPDGSLDFDDELLEQLDFVIASIHSSFSQSQDKIMARLRTAIENPHVHMIAHPTGRIIGSRTGYDPDVPTLIEWASEFGKILELNANPHRLDLETVYLKMAQEKGVPIAINTDAHHLDQLRYMDVGVKYAQKAWLHKENIVNTWTLDKFKQYLKK
ncbi:DNA polymerase/3'-5' exonuclease PolX [Psychrobacillus sp. FSL K6-2684]|uniref:DNA polymerase/3'-5' exonuclease PolX n=1 Tax=Psychrobacillus faecigallinarum TaxID=2762235 RepID=A0ABR8R757_9BACI|nr:MULTISPECIES: DNA polymerase/3'-5' exonuclease PolX [Psychrobacillus]MBD7943628.1 DNA polymerase/3'-5' exonuclease PolX [Psychrobacillus faecigallinarum]QEY22777.1 DNA polymerase/3'-5' exonuclease PolX [Psychrobacillus sp. AK 1817]